MLYNNYSKFILLKNFYTTKSNTFDKVSFKKTNNFSLNSFSKIKKSATFSKNINNYKKSSFVSNKFWKKSNNHKPNNYYNNIKFNSFWKRKRIKKTFINLYVSEIDILLKHKAAKLFPLRQLEYKYTRKAEVRVRRRVRNCYVGLWNWYLSKLLLNNYSSKKFVNKKEYKDFKKVGKIRRFLYKKYFGNLLLSKQVDPFYFMFINGPSEHGFEPELQKYHGAYPSTLLKKAYWDNRKPIWQIVAAEDKNNYNKINKLLGIKLLFMKWKKKEYPKEIKRELKRKFYKTYEIWKKMPAWKKLFSYYNVMETRSSGSFYLTQIGRLLWKQGTSFEEASSTETSLGIYKLMEYNTIIYQNNMIKQNRLFRKYISILRASHFGLMYDMLTLNKWRYIAAKHHWSRPTLAFCTNYYKLRNNLWQSIMKYKRYLYIGGYKPITKAAIKFNIVQKYRPFARNKHPDFFKRNKLFYWYGRLLKNFRGKFVVQSQKHVRIGNVLSKIIYPFYGHWHRKQFKKLTFKIQFLKSMLKSKEELLLSKLECRLDVLAYRLNLVPTLAWARDFVRNGGLYVYNKNYNWDKVFGSLLNVAYPLSLRDPKSIYTTNYDIIVWSLLKYRFLNVFKKNTWVWLNRSQFSNMKFFSVPILNPDYLTKPGDVVQTTPYFLQQQEYKIRLSLLFKPIPKHLYTVSDFRWFWVFYRDYYSLQATAFWQRKSLSYISAVVLKIPKWKNFQYEDRIKSNNFKYLFLS